MINQVKKTVIEIFNIEWSSASFLNTFEKADIELLVNNIKCILPIM